MLIFIAGSFNSLSNGSDILNLNGNQPPTLETERKKLFRNFMRPTQTRLVKYFLGLPPQLIRDDQP